MGTHGILSQHRSSGHLGLHRLRHTRALLIALQQHTSIYDAPDIMVSDRGSQMSAVAKESIDLKAVMGVITSKGSNEKLCKMCISGGTGEPRGLFRWPSALLTRTLRLTPPSNSRNSRPPSMGSQPYLMRDLSMLGL